MCRRSNMTEGDPNVRHIEPILHGGSSRACCEQLLCRPDLPVVHTGRTKCYNNTTEIDCPQAGQPFYGQDAQHRCSPLAYRDNGDGSVTGLKPGLMWVKARGAKVSWDEPVAGAARCRVGGYQDWRMPTIKELYSLINFWGCHQDLQLRSLRERRLTPFCQNRRLGSSEALVTSASRL
jgi:hypothetical protein